MTTCHLCKDEATETKVWYTVFAHERGYVPFRDPQRHEFLVCSKHAQKAGWDGMALNRAAVSERRKTGNKHGELPITRYYAEGKQDFIALEQTVFERLCPIKLKYHAEITDNDIRKALSTDSHQSPSKEVKQERTRARWSTIRNTIIGFAVGIVILIFGLIYGHGIAILAGIVGLTIFPLLMIVQFIRVSINPNRKSPEDVAKTFYQNILPESLASGEESTLIAFQTLAPNVAKRDDSNPFTSLRQSWDKVWKDTEYKLVSRHRSILGYDDHSFRSTIINIKSSPINDSSTGIALEIWYFLQKEKSDVGWAIIELDNVAIQIGDKWYLIAWDSGGLQSVDDSPSQL